MLCLSSLPLLFTLLAPVQDAAAPAPDPRAELAKVTKTVVDATSYSFEQILDEKGGFRGDTGPVTTKGTFQKGLPVRLQMDDETTYLADDQLLYSTGEKKWKVFDGESALQGGGGDMEWTIRMFSLQFTMLPHRVLDGFDAKIAAVEKVQEEGTTRYRGEFSPAGAEEFSGAARMKEMASRFGAGGLSLKVAGTYEVDVVGGKIEKIVFHTTVSGDFGGRTMDRSRTVTLTPKELGEAKLEVPSEVLAMIEL